MSTPAPRPDAWRLFIIWTSIGLQSFGGGASTLLLIQRAFIERTGWVTDEEFLRMWNLCLLTPGINLIAVTALIGKKFDGARGIVASLTGLLLPSGIITCLLAALFVQVERSSTTQAVLRGIIPATGGVMALVALNFAQPLIKRARVAGALRLPLLAALAIVGAALVIVFNVSAIVIVLGLGLIGAVAFAPRSPGQTAGEETPR